MLSDLRFAPLSTHEMERRKNVNSVGDRDMSDYQALKVTEDAKPSDKIRTKALVWLLAAFAVFVAIGIATS